MYTQLSTSTSTYYDTTTGHKIFKLFCLAIKMSMSREHLIDRHVIGYHIALPGDAYILL